MTSVKECKTCGAGALSSDAYCVVCGAPFDDVLMGEAKRNNKQADIGMQAKAGKRPGYEPARKGGAAAGRGSRIARQKERRRMRPTTVAFLVVLGFCALIWGVNELKDARALAWLGINREQANTPKPENNILPQNQVLPALAIEIQPKNIAPEGYIGITTKEELFAINDDLSANYILLNDIDLKGSSEDPWTPIGMIATRYYTTLSEIGGFSGVFDGNGHTITGMVVYLPEAGPAQVSAAGLFSLVLDGTVKNLSVSGRIELAGMPGKYTYAGGIAGANIAYHRGANIVNCVFSGQVQGAAYVGGITGISAAYKEGQTASVSHCKNTGTITGDTAGGIVGFADANAPVAISRVRACANFGSVAANSTASSMAGGIVGGAQTSGAGSHAYIERSYNMGSIGSLGRAGGVVGVATAINASAIRIEYCYNRAEIQCGKRAGGIVAMGVCQSSQDETALRLCYNTGLLKGEKDAIGAIAGGSGDQPEFAMEHCYYTAEAGCKDAFAARITIQELQAALAAGDGESAFAPEVGLDSLPALLVPPIEE